MRTPSREVLFDPTGRLAGRGARTCDRSAAFDRVSP
ncbi:MAG: YlxR family protein [Chloroflexota bacterium]|nr:YlxR family protein [Chloroflexota bacterium]